MNKTRNHRIIIGLFLGVLMLLAAVGFMPTNAAAAEITNEGTNLQQQSDNDLKSILENGDLMEYVTAHDDNHILDLVLNDAETYVQSIEQICASNDVKGATMFLYLSELVLDGMPTISVFNMINALSLLLKCVAIALIIWALSTIMKPLLDFAKFLVMIPVDMIYGVAKFVKERLDNARNQKIMFGDSDEDPNKIIAAMADSGEGMEQVKQIVDEDLLIPDDESTE